METRSTRNRTALLGVAAIATINLIATGCGPVRVNESKRKPAQINMAGYEQITVGRIDATMPSAMVATIPLRQRLIAALQNTRIYQVYDRDALAEGLREVELAQYLGQGNSRMQFQNANALVTGNVDRLTFSDREETQQQYVSEYETVTIYRRVGQADIGVMLRVIDLENMEVVASSQLNDTVTVETPWFRERPARLNPDPSYAQLYDRVVAEFMKKIAPYYVDIEVVLYDRGPSPLKPNAMRYFKAREYAAAESSFVAIVETLKLNPKTKPKALAEAMHNVAVAQEFQGRLEEAMETADAAIALHPNKHTLHLKNRLRVRMTDRDAFENQGLN
jgi:curli biogenesis system outer membrane secretion channel CsgG